MYQGFREPPGEGPISCVYLATVLSFVDFIPFFYIFARSPPHLNRSPPLPTSQTWSQLFAKCSYQQNRSETPKVVCSKVLDPLPVSFFVVAFALAVFLLLFNLITINKNLTYAARIFRTIVHAVFSVELFATALIYYFNRYWCYDCKELIFICLIPIVTTIFMSCNWYECNGEDGPRQTVHAQNERIHFINDPSPRLATNPVIPSSAEQAVPAAPVPPPKTNPDPELENQYNNWLETHRNNIAQHSSI